MRGKIPGNMVLINYYTKTARLLSVLFFSEIANISYIIV